MKIAITGAQSYTGRYVAELLLAKGKSILNLSNHSREWSIKSDRISNQPLKFEKDHLVQTLKGCDTLVQTYWVRFDNTLGVSRDQVTKNSKLLIDSAREAGVKKIIYTSHTQTSLDCPLDYIREKANIEKYLKESGLKWGIVKPCGIFGRSAQESILLNNFAYLIKRLPIFPMPGHGNYLFQWVHVEDMAELIVKCIESQQNLDVDAVGPDNISFKEQVSQFAKIFKTTCYPVTGVNKRVATALTQPFNWYFDDIFIDRNDLDIMTSGLTCSLKQPTGKRSLLKWVDDNKQDLGQKWISSIKRYYK